MMYEFEDWLRDCYEDKEISLKEMEDAMASEYKQLGLWKDYIDSFQYPEKLYTVKEALEKFVVNADPTLP